MLSSYIFAVYTHMDFYVFQKYLTIRAKTFNRFENFSCYISCFFRFFICFSLFFVLTREMLFIFNPLTFIFEACEMFLNDANEGNQNKASYYLISLVIERT